MRFRCQICGERVSAGADLFGKSIECPNCYARVSVPTPHRRERKNRVGEKRGIGRSYFLPALLGGSGAATISSLSSLLGGGAGAAVVLFFIVGLLTVLVKKLLPF